MKQRILVAAASVLLAALILLLLPAYPPAAPPTVPTEPTVPPTTEPLPTMVRLYSCDPESLPILSALAADYTEQTGVEVVVLTAGKTGCQAMLEMLMAGEHPPTILCLHGQKDLDRWQNDLLDLHQTPLAETLCADAFGFHGSGRLLAIPMELEGMGLLFNAQLLSVIMTRGDIQDYPSLVTAVQVLESNGLTAFAGVPHWTSVWLRLLHSSDLETMRAFMDLYMRNQIGKGDAKDQFMSGKTVFFLGTTADYNELSQHPDPVLEMMNLDILPACTSSGMHYICRTAWGINANAREEDREAALAFMQWLVTRTEDAPAPIDRLQTLTPFRDAAWYNNQLEKKLRSYMQTEAAVVVWDAKIADDRMLLMALDTYAKAPTDANWAAVTALLATPQS